MFIVVVVSLCTFVRIRVYIIREKDQGDNIVAMVTVMLRQEYIKLLFNQRSNAASNNHFHDPLLVSKAQS